MYVLLLLVGKIFYTTKAPSVCCDVGFGDSNGLKDIPDWVNSICPSKTSLTMKNWVATYCFFNPHSVESKPTINMSN